MASATREPTASMCALHIPENTPSVSSDENRTLTGVIALVSSELELRSMLQGVVDLATDATGCHACFIYLLEHDRLTMRAASPVFADAVGVVQMRLDEGLTGWVARHRQPEFIRDGAMDDPRMKYFPVLREEDFQSMAAVPILSRASETIGVIVLHTQAPHEFPEGTLTLLVHIASLVSGAIENAQLYERERRRVDTLTGLSSLAQAVAAATDADTVGALVADATRTLLGAELCQLFGVESKGGELSLLASSPPAAATPLSDLAVAGMLVTPLQSGDERLGLLCARPGSARPFGDEERELARAIAHLAAVALERADLIESLTNDNIVKDLFEALATGATAFAATKATQVRCDLSAPYALICAEPAGGIEPSSGEWRATAEQLGQDLAALQPRAAIEAGPGPLRSLIGTGPRRGERLDELAAACHELGRHHRAAIGISELYDTHPNAARAYREAIDAATIGRALLGDGGAIRYSELGAYRYLVHIAAEDAPRDRMRAAVEILIDYDDRRRTSMLDTLERYLAERRSVIETARALFIHPNTLRQRLGRIEELTGLELDRDDLLSLELAIKLARLHRGAASARTGAPAIGGP
jgi:GAF domain-containing protein